MLPFALSITGGLAARRGQSQSPQRPKSLEVPVVTDPRERPSDTADMPGAFPDSAAMFSPGTPGPQVTRHSSQSMQSPIYDDDFELLERSASSQPKADVDDTGFVMVVHPPEDQESERGADESALENVNRGQHEVNLFQATVAYLTVCRQINSYCQTLRLPHTVSETAQWLFKAVVGANICQLNTEDVLMASCMFVACRRHGYPRTYEEIQSLTGVHKTDISSAYNLLVRCKVEQESIPEQRPVVRRKPNKLSKSGPSSRFSKSGKYIPLDSPTDEELKGMGDFPSHIADSDDSDDNDGTRPLLGKTDSPSISPFDDDNAYIEEQQETLTGPFERFTLSGKYIPPDSPRDNNLEGMGWFPPHIADSDSEEGGPQGSPDPSQSLSSMRVLVSPKGQDLSAAAEPVRQSKPLSRRSSVRKAVSKMVAPLSRGLGSLRRRREGNTGK